MRRSVAEREWLDAGSTQTKVFVIREGLRLLVRRYTELPKAAKQDLP